MRKMIQLGTVALASLALVACHGRGGKAPTGQVVATVDGKEITVTDLQAEMAGQTFADPKARKAAQDSVLENMVVRAILAQAAQKDGLDKSPEFAVQKAHMEQGLLAQTLQKKVVDSVPAPSREEADRYVADHPDIFGQRKIYDVDQIRVTQSPDPNIVAEVGPLKTLPEILGLLAARGAKFTRQPTAIDARAVDPQLVDAIGKLPPREVFTFQGNGVFLINQITATRVEPFTGEPAVTYATALIKRQRTQEALGRKLNDVVTRGKAGVRFNPQYQPTKKAAAPAPAAAAAPQASR
jgi:EpsD family peptidyl-prolyl cis-trans isomerase